MNVLKMGNSLLQRIADRGNWLTDDERDAVRDEYNRTVGVFMCLDRAMRYTFGSDSVDTKRGNCVWKKSVLDFMKWYNDGKKLIRDYEKFVKVASLNYCYADDVKMVEGGAEALRVFNDAVVNMAVTVKGAEM